MATTLNLKTKVLPGKRIEITSPELNEGDFVDVLLTLPDSNGADSETQPESAWEVLRRLAGTVEMPEDWSDEHDHYLYGSPKRSERK